jgi:hypothetical protein
VQDRLDIAAAASVAIPVIFDLVNRQAIWCDVALKNDPRWHNNVHGNLKGIQASLRSFLDLRKPNLHDLLTLHARARGVIAETPSGADTVFSVENGTPFQLETIASEYMA